MDELQLSILLQSTNCWGACAWRERVLRSDGETAGPEMQVVVLVS